MHMEEHLSRKLGKVEEAHVNCKHGESWSLINEISGRRTFAGGKLEGITEQRGLENAYNHFKNLLGNLPVKSLTMKMKMKIYQQFSSYLTSMRGFLTMKSTEMQMSH